MTGVGCAGGCAHAVKQAPRVSSFLLSCQRKSQASRRLVGAISTCFLIDLPPGVFLGAEAAGSGEGLVNSSDSLRVLGEQVTFLVVRFMPIERMGAVETARPLIRGAKDVPSGIRGALQRRLDLGQGGEQVRF